MNFDTIVGDLPDVSDPEKISRSTTRTWPSETVGSALRSRDYPLVFRMLSEGKPASTNDVIWTIEHCPVNVLEALFDSSLGINQKINESHPPPLALTFHNLETTKMFLGRKASPTAGCKFDITFSVAVQEASLETIELLFAYGARLDYVVSKGAPVSDIMFQSHLVSFYHFKPLGLGTPLHTAAQQGDMKAVELLLNCGADPNIEDTRGQLPIQLAWTYNFPEVVQILEVWLGDRAKLGQRL